MSLKPTFQKALDVLQKNTCLELITALNIVGAEPEALEHVHKITDGKLLLSTWLIHNHDVSPMDILTNEEKYRASNIAWCNWIVQNVD